MNGDDQPHIDSGLAHRLRSLDRPRNPDEGFEARLRSELFEGGAPVDRGPEPIDSARTSPPSRRGPWILAAAAIALVAVVGGLLWTGSDDGEVVSDEPSRQLDISSAAAACRRFNDTAYGTLSRADLLPEGESAKHLATFEAAQLAAARLGLALTTLVTDLEHAGVDVATIEGDVAQIRDRLGRITHPELANATMTSALAYLGATNDLLTLTQRSLTEAGVARCL